jgi:hypothetical protein
MDIHFAKVIPYMKVNGLLHEYFGRSCGRILLL